MSHLLSLRNQTNHRQVEQIYFSIYAIRGLSVLVFPPFRGGEYLLNPTSSVLEMVEESYHRLERTAEKMNVTLYKNKVRERKDTCWERCWWCWGGGVKKS